MGIQRVICGIDEAGRGPLAGPLVMAGVVLTEKLEGLADSKKLSSKQREKLYNQIIATSKYHIVVIDHKKIDQQGISVSLHNGLEEIKSILKGYDYLFDGNSTFGVEGIETMVQADAKIAQVSAASILAKVTRDSLMLQLAKEFPEYGFEQHKGYGTKLHIERVRKFGRCKVHRKSFYIKSIDEPQLF